MAIRTRLAGIAAKFISGRVVLLLLGSVVAAGAWAWWATNEMRECNQDLGGMIATAGQNEKAVVALSERLSQEVTQRVLDLEAERAANAVLENRLAELQAQTTKERRDRDAIYDTDDDCAAWRADLVCSAISERLRERAEALGPDAGRSAGAGDAADTGRADRAADDRGPDA